MPAAPDAPGEPHASLGSGALVHADVLARLLGLRLLRLEADIVLAPATPAAPFSPAPVVPAALSPAVTGSRLSDARRLLADAESITNHSRRRAAPQAQ